MNTLEAIAARRSIRRFKNTPVPEELLKTILTAGIQAPSGKNKQPWKFVVVRGDKREEMIRVMQAGLEKRKAAGEEWKCAEWSFKIMAQAPVTVFVLHPQGRPPWLAHSIDENFWDVVDMQSSGAAIQNMLLAAQEMGLGSLWICDIFCAYEELLAWLGEKGEFVAAVSFGYPDESPDARPRKPLSEAVRYL